MTAAHYATTLAAGIALGFTLGIMAAAYVSNKADKRYVETGFVMLDGMVFGITKMERPKP